MVGLVGQNRSHTGCTDTFHHLRKLFFRLEKKLTFAFETTASTADFDIFDVYLLSDLRRRFKVAKDKRSEHEI